MNQATLGMVPLAALLPTRGGTAAAQDPDDRIDVAILPFEGAGQAAPRIAAAVRQSR